jgi:predicted nuclease with RNAse H fold
MLFVGVDLSARRGFDVAVLDDERRVRELWRAATLDLLSAGLAAYAGPLIVAVDAPQAPSDFPLRRAEVRAGLPVPPAPGRFARYRVCDYELARRGIGLYLLPEPGAAPPAWMALGFATFRRMQACHNLRVPRDAADHAATLLEVYPYAGFVTLLGGRPPRKTTHEGMAVRVEALRGAGLRGECNPPTTWEPTLPGAGFTHDAVDALCAAFTAWAWPRGLGCALGRPDEGLIVLPVPAGALKERYGPYISNGAPRTGQPGHESCCASRNTVSIRA